MNKVFPELVKRYGGYLGCTRGQVEATLPDLNVPQDVMPYMYGAALAGQELTQVETEYPDVNWEEVRNRSAILLKEYKLHALPSRAHYYESGIGMIGIDHHA